MLKNIKFVKYLQRNKNLSKALSSRTIFNLENINLIFSASINLEQSTPQVLT